MIGHQNLSCCDSIIFIVGSSPSWFDGENQGNIGLVYTQKSRPKSNDANFVRGKSVQVIHGENASDELFCKWLAEIIKTNPKTVIAMDSEKEIFVC